MTTTDKLQALMALFHTAAEAYVEKELLRYRGLNSDSVNERYETEWAALRSALEQVLADAERYQHLRGGKARKPQNVRGGYIQVYRWQDRGEAIALKGPELDAAIDEAIAARSAEPQAGEKT